MNRWSIGLAATVAGFLLVGVSWGDQGMWLMNDPPKKLLKEKYHFDAGSQWYIHLQQASVRFNSGGSGSFVSADGLVMTNHHVGADALQKMGTKDHNYIKEGFFARSREAEIKCADLELNVLMSIEDVTERINAAVRPEMDPAEAFKARRAAMNTVEKESFEKTGLRSDVITLYHGGMYNLYRFKRYTDVRLVFAPEQDAAFFGGDPDNFEYPRFDLDICFFHVYEDGKPAKPSHYLKWSSKGVSDDELIFVSGHPGKTDRLNTYAHLEFIRDRALPLALQKLFRWEVLTSTFSARSEENARRAQDDLFGIANSRKARYGGLEGLQDPSVMRIKLAEEKALRQAINENAKVRAACGDPWKDVLQSLHLLDGIYVKHDLLERGSGLRSELFRIARTLVRMADEDGKPNADRLREFTESSRPSLEQELYSEAPIYDNYETLKLGDSLMMYGEWLGVGDPLLRQILADKSPQERAAELVVGTKLKDVAYRKQLAKGGKQAIAECHDPMIELAKLVDGPAREVRKTFEEKVEEPQRQAYARLANARFALYGTNIYPDATFTLRLAFGVVKGYEEQGRHIPAWTTIAGAYEHAAEHNNIPPFNLPESWLKHKDKLDLGTPLNFVSTADIIGGNSGSPVVNRQGELVGIIFDGNIQSLVWDYVFDDTQGRATAVDARGIVEALRKIYGAQSLADELGR